MILVKCSASWEIQGVGIYPPLRVQIMLEPLSIANQLLSHLCLYVITYFITWHCSNGTREYSTQSTLQEINLKKKNWRASFYFCSSFQLLSTKTRSFILKHIVVACLFQEDFMKMHFQPVKVQLLCKTTIKTQRKTRVYNWKSHVNSTSKK